MVLFFDTETTGVPKNYNGSMTDLDNWPRVIQLAWALFNDNGTLFDSQVDLIKPNGWTMPTEKFWIDNGFSQQQSLDNGIEIKQALNQFIVAIGKADLLVAHNIKFDYPIVGAEMIRENLKSDKRINRFCTMLSTVDYCQILGAYGFKWPKLEELHKKLFGCAFDGAHDAMNDVMATAKCYFELKNKSII